ncbi:MAG: hypothetical protein JSW45_12205 [Thiotrichales bacterium]|nr:MAG: hypothetical protein JSW45_12205 [Thiotrichales bacterium]
MRTDLMLRPTSVFLAVLLYLPALPVWSGESLDRFELEELVYDKTANCRKEKDQSLCINYFSPEGEIIQVRDSGKRKDGRWFLDDSDHLCILWNGKIRPLCFVVTKNGDGTFNMTRHGKHKSTILKISNGNTENYQ